jgi:hypothetical protein
VNLTAAAILAMVLSFAVYGTLGVLYAIPALARRDRMSAITPLLWVMTSRHIALQLFSSRELAGMEISVEGARQIAFGDVAGMLLALLALYAVRYRWRLALPLVWLVVVATVLDLSNALVVGLREELFATASNVSWFILTFVVPALWVALALLVWRLLNPAGAVDRAGSGPGTLRKEAV